MKVRPSTSELGALVAAGAPLALASVVQTLVGTLAVAVAGRLGARELGAVGLGASIYFTVAVFGVGVLLGIDPVVTRALGRGDREAARRVLSQGLWLALIAFLVLAVALVGVTFSIRHTGLEARTAELVRAYIWGRLPGLLPYLAFVVVRSYQAARGETRSVLGAAVLSNLCVLATAPLLAGGAGVLGVGLAERLGASVQLAALLAGLRGFLRAPGFDLFRPLLGAGVPVGLAMVAEYAVFAILGVLVASLEPAQLGAHQIALTWVGTLFMLPVGFSGAVAARVGNALGRGDRDAARRAGRAALSAGFGLGLGLSACLWLIPESLARWLTNDAEVVAVAVPLIRVAALALVADSVQAVLGGAVRGAGDTRFALFASVVGHYGLGLPVGLFLSIGVGLGASGLWLGLALGLAGVAVLLALRFIRVARPSEASTESCEPRSLKSSLPAPWAAPACSPHRSLGPATSRLHP